MSVGQMVGFSKEEIQNDVRDLKDRYKTSMLGPSVCRRGSIASPFDDSGGSFSQAPGPSKRRKFEDDQQSEDDKARHEDVKTYLSKTCRTEIFLRSASDSEITKMISVKNDFNFKDGKTVTMYIYTVGGDR